MEFKAGAELEGAALEELAEAVEDIVELEAEILSELEAEIEEEAELRDVVDDIVALNPRSELVEDRGAETD